MWPRRPTCSAMPATGWKPRNGFVVEMGRDPLTGFHSTNFSILRPYGVWVVISPFNFPCALTGGPAAAALVTGNTVVMKPATDTPWTSRLIAECLRDAGLPDGVFNFVTGPGSTLGQAVIEGPEVAGITFTGSYDVGMKIHRDFCQDKWIRPDHSGAGRQEPGDRHPPCRPGDCRDRHRPLGVWPAGPEVLGLLARFHRRAGV